MFIQASLPVQIFKQGRQYVAYSPVLDLSTSGKNRIDARRMFAEAVNIFFEELQEMGTLDQVLKDLGWVKASRHDWQPPQIFEKPLKIKVPITA